MHALVSGLAQHHDVSLLSLVDASAEEGDVTATEEYCNDVVTVRHSRAPNKRLLQMAATISPWSYERWLTWVPALQRKLDDMLTSERFDVVQLEFAHTAVFRVRATNGVRPVVCLDEHNIEYEILLRTARGRSSLLRRAYNALDGIKVRSEEKRAWSRVDGCAVCSVRDEETLLEEAPGTRTVVVPNGVDLESFTLRNDSQREPATLLFFGAIDYYPNTDAVLHFLDEVMPRLASRNPRIKLCVVGRRPPESVLARRAPNVEITGAVDDVRPWIERATAVVVPLRIGGGTRLKILEAMAMGKAIVSTTLGAEGIDAIHDRDLLLADDPETFAAQAMKTIDEPELATRLGRAARRLVVEKYGWQASVDRLSEFHGELLAARRPA